MKYFGTDGIRGVAYDFLNEELAFKVGTSLSVLNLKNVVIGRDTRESGSMLAKAIIAGAKAVGLNTLYLGVVSTPMLSYISGKLGSVGVMITASHNPYQDNGIKVFKIGKKLYASEESALEDILNDVHKAPILGEHGRSIASVDPYKLYYKLFHHMHIKTSLKIGLDLANGATYAIGKRIFQKLTPYLEIIGDLPDGKNINLGVGSTHLEKLIELVQSKKLDVGFAFDGDGDRLLAIDSDGSIIDGDKLIYIIANYLKEKNRLNDNTVVLTKMSNLGIIKALSRNGIQTIQTDVGDKYVLEALETNNYTLGGENSGHVINRYLLNTGDGVLNAVLLVKIMKETKKSLRELCQDVTLYPDKLVNLRDIDKALIKDPSVIETVEKAKFTLGEDGLVLVRASGTEPLIRISVQAKTETMVDSTIETIVQAIKNAEQTKS
ncbi:MAG: phosphoglucosamine mutase [Tenericutes bacterium HGW-Tenericutes-1]|jgi:phosphoglucosamine mutase|nr:MAG: phosphoglucosamine mutase [Tenericutes bacterium HGW-Tenericutes-1]